MNFLRQGIRKLSYDRHTYIRADATEITYHAASRVVKIISVPYHSRFDCILLLHLRLLGWQLAIIAGPQERKTIYDVLYFMHTVGSGSQSAFSH